MPKPLTKTKEDGTLYVRPAVIEACIAELEGLPEKQRLERCYIGKRDKPGYVYSEALVYFLRQTKLDQHSTAANLLFRILMKRIQANLRATIPDWRIAHAVALREEVVSRFWDKFAQDVSEGTNLLDFFEVRFDSAFASLRTTVLRELGPGSQPGESVSLETDPSRSLPLEVEEATKLWQGVPSKLDDPAFRSALYLAIESLPEDQKQVLKLLLQDMPIDSKDPGVLTVANMLKCDERTIRNRRDRALNRLRALLIQEIQ